MATAPSATVVVLDVGKGMDGRNGAASYLEQAVQAVSLLVETKILHFPRDELSVVLFGTRETNNDLGHMGYEHVVTLRGMSPPDVELLKLLDGVSPGETEGDFVDALLVATDILMRVQNTKAKLRMYMLTGGHSFARVDDLDDLRAKFVEHSIGFNFIAADFFDNGGDADAADMRAVTAVKRNNERVLRDFADAVAGTFHHMAEGLQLLSAFRTKATRQVPTYSGTLEIGEAQIPLKLFIKAKKSAFPSLKKLSGAAQALQQQAAQEGDAPDDVPTLDCKMERDYVGVVEPDKAFADRRELLKGYRYGKKIVTLAKEDMDALKYKAEKCMRVIAFVPRAQVPRHYFMGQPELCVAEPGNNAAAQALASLVVALLPPPASEGGVAKREPGPAPGLDTVARVALVRLVKRDDKAPTLACLVPHIKHGQHYGFYCHKLPFCEDIRTYDFPGLTREHLARPQLSPSPEQLAAMGGLVRALDLEHGGPDGVPLLRPALTFNPAVLHLYQALRYRATKVPVTVGDVIDPSCVQLFPPGPDGRPPMTLEEAQRLPELEPAVRETMEPHSALWGRPDAAQAVARAQNNVFTVQRVEKKGGAGKRKFWDQVTAQQALANAPNLTSYRVDADAPNADADADKDGDKGKRGKKAGALTMQQLLHGELMEEIGPQTPVADFKAMMARRDRDMVEPALAQMAAMVAKLVQDSIHGHLYQKALECAEALRSGAVVEDEPEYWNEFLRFARSEYRLGMHRGFWAALVQRHLSLIHEDECVNTAVTVAQSDAFLRDDTDDVPEPEPMAVEADDDDLMDALE